VEHSCHDPHPPFVLESSAAAGAAFAAGSYFVSESQAQQPKSLGERVQIGIMGVNGRGGALAQGFMQQPNCEIAYICDVDENVLGRVTKTVGDKQEKKPQGVRDFRKILDDKSVDALLVAAEPLARRPRSQAVQPASTSM
jgi:hypothetical protein